jgi:hypothetical protein
LETLFRVPGSSWTSSSLSRKETGQKNEEAPTSGSERTTAGVLLLVKKVQHGHLQVDWFDSHRTSAMCERVRTLRLYVMQCRFSMSSAKYERLSCALAGAIVTGKGGPHEE